MIYPYIINFGFRIKIPYTQFRVCIPYGSQTLTDPETNFIALLFNFQIRLYNVKLPSQQFKFEEAL